MNKIILVYFFFLSICSIAQTKTIAHKRHGGSKSSFTKSLELEGRKGGSSNLGNYPEMNLKFTETKVKKVIYVDDTTILFVHETTSINDNYIEDQDPFFVIDSTNLYHPFSHNIDNDSLKKIIEFDMSIDNTSEDTIIYENFEKRLTEYENTIKKQKRIVKEAEGPTKIEKKRNGFSFFRSTLLSLILVIGAIITLDINKKPTK